MFRRLASGLPRDPVFAKDLKGLGYFINEQDEIRNIKNPKAYFQYFLTKNERYNEVQREGMNEAIRNIVIERLEKLGLTKLRLPLGASEIDRHVPILISENLKKKKEIIVLFYELKQDLGVFAYRVLGGKGGINAGSAVNFVKYIQDSAAKNGKDCPGIILANIGQLYWSCSTKKAMTMTSWLALSRKSAADPYYDFDETRNTIPGNRTEQEHIAYVFNNVIGNPDLCNQDSKIQVLGVSDGAVQATWFLHDPKNFARWCGGTMPVSKDGWAVTAAEITPTSSPEKTYFGDFIATKKNPRVIAFASVATSVTVPNALACGNYGYKQITNDEFKKWFAQHGRCYFLSHEPAGTFLAPAEGNKKSKYGQAFGAPSFSLGESGNTESMLPVGHKIITDWFFEVNADPEYCNPQLERTGIEDEVEEDNQFEDEARWDVDAKVEELDSWGEDNKIDYAQRKNETIPEIKVTGDELPPLYEVHVVTSAEEKKALEKLNTLFSNLNAGGKTLREANAKEMDDSADDGDDDGSGDEDEKVDENYDEIFNTENLVISDGRPKGTATYDPEVGE